MRSPVLAMLAIATVLPSTIASADNGGAYHVLPMAALRATHPDALMQSQNATRQMLYYGGPVPPDIKVVTVFWGNGVAAQTLSTIGPFLRGMVNSSFVDQLKQYSTNLTAINGRAGTHQAIMRGTYKGQFKITPLHTAKTLTDAAIQSELKSQIAAKHLPASDQNTLYMVYFPPSIVIDLGNSLSCIGFGAYHSANPGTVGKNIFYGVMPDCQLGFAALTSASSHEFAEALTDGIPTPGSHPAYPQAWNDSGGNEVADLCEGTRATLTAGGKAYTVTQVFLNTTKACSTGNYHSP